MDIENELKDEIIQMLMDTPIEAVIRHYEREGIEDEYLELLREEQIKWQIGRTMLGFVSK